MGRLAHARAVLAALVAASAVLAALEWLVYVTRALPRSPTIAILAWVEKVYTVAAGTVFGLVLYQFVWNKLESVPD